MIFAMAIALRVVAAQAETVEQRLMKAEPPLQQRLDTLQSKYRCPITAYLSEIHRRPLKEKDRYLILWISPRPEIYVQCMFFDDDRQIHCEAASGYYGEKLPSFMTPSKFAALAAFGFSTDAAVGNFVHERAVPDVDALYDIAGLLIETLVRVYDMAIDDVLRYQAPLVPSPPRPLTGRGRHCPALISAR
jgi:hypothetical protein